MIHESVTSVAYASKFFICSEGFLLPSVTCLACEWAVLLHMSRSFINFPGFSLYYRFLFFTSTFMLFYKKLWIALIPVMSICFTDMKLISCCLFVFMLFYEQTLNFKGKLYYNVFEGVLSDIQTQLTQSDISTNTCDQVHVRSCKNNYVKAPSWLAITTTHIGSNILKFYCIKLWPPIFLTVDLKKGDVVLAQQFNVTFSLYLWVYDSG